LQDKNDTFYKDNDERAIFFARGVLETVQKLRWSPDIIHCHGWFTALIPLYVKKSFKDNPLFSDAKLVYSIYEDGFDKELDKNFKTKLLYDGITKKDVELLATPSFENLTKLAVDNSDGLIMGSPQINTTIENYVSDSKKPLLPFKNTDDYIDAYAAFYDELLSK